VKTRAKKAVKKTIDEWAKQGVSRVRLAVWANPEDYIRLDQTERGTFGPWLHLYAPCQAPLGYPTTQDVGVWTVGPQPEWEQYTGPRHQKDEHP